MSNRPSHRVEVRVAARSVEAERLRSYDKYNILALIMRTNNGANADVLKPVVFVGRSLEELKEFPAQAIRELGYALHQAQAGETSPKAKPLKGFGGTSVFEVVEDFDTDAYRAIYTVRFAEAIYVLHCFQKKSKSGVKTPPQQIEMVKRRLAIAEDAHREWIERRTEETP